MGSIQLSLVVVMWLLRICFFLFFFSQQYYAAQNFEAQSFGKISSPDVTCGRWTRNTVLVGPTTVATVISQLVGIKKCVVVFKLAGGCSQMKMACSNFNVPKGPERWFSVSPPGKGYTNGNRPRRWQFSTDFKLMYRGKKSNPLKCKVTCAKS